MSEQEEEFETIVSVTREEIDNLADELSDEPEEPKTRTDAFYSKVASIMAREIGSYLDPVWNDYLQDAIKEAEKDTD